MGPCIPGKTRCPGKNCWPELYGTIGEKALAVIKRESNGAALDSQEGNPGHYGLPLQSRLGLGR
ncbi:hypothetical protein CDL15_Pgr010408 [Punica granatum]|uniref:Uncharacterized protein n=1 Tax=Punica granatum TaxID=22663 RepID=A0A218W293_PUNGR|nr:hypothetical protein CDL15_Pgr010408 [Punica granatum]